jgi:hypothetical protein
MTNVASAPMGMRLKTIATLFAVSAVILTGSPAFATQISRHDAHNQNIESCRTFEACSPRDVHAQHSNRGNTVPDHWPNNMILG